MPRSPKWSLKVLWLKFWIYFSSLPCKLHVLPTSFFLIYPNIWWIVQVMKLLIKQCSWSSCYFLYLRSKYSPQLLYSLTPLISVLPLSWETKFNVNKTTDNHDSISTVKVQILQNYCSNSFQSDIKIIITVLSFRFCLTWNLVKHTFIN
jgi:hypothetical protein